MSELQAVAVIPIKPESVAELRGPLASLAEQTRAEEGCLSYELYESAAVPGTFITLERWRSQEDLDAHLASPHVAAALAAADGAFAGELGIHPLRPVG